MRQHRQADATTTLRPPRRDRDKWAAPEHGEKRRHTRATPAARAPPKKEQALGGEVDVEVGAALWLQIVLNRVSLDATHFSSSTFDLHRTRWRDEQTDTPQKSGPTVLK